MRPGVVGLALLAAGLCAALAGETLRSAAKSRNVADAVRVALDALPPAQRANATIPFDDDERKNWHFVPRDRRGVLLKDMDDAGRRATHSLLRELLSTRGYLTATTIMSRDEELLRIEQGSGPVRDPLRYALATFGAPGETAPWGVRFEGHHLSLNFTFAGDGVAVTPLFLGANPAEVRDGSRAGLAPLAEPERLGHAVIRSLDAERRKAACISSAAPADILLGPGLPAVLPSTEGVAVSSLEPAAQDLVRAFVDAVAGTVDPALDPEPRRAAADDLRFAFAGDPAPGKGCYFRVWCERWAMELDDVQNGANHVHLVWRDAHDDFGARLISEHRGRSHDHGDHEHDDGDHR